MSMEYNGSHSITFIKGSIEDTYVVKNSWKDFHLIPTMAFSPPVPSVQYTIVDAPFSSKSVDYTDQILKGAKLSYPSNTYIFIVDHDYWADWVQAKEELTTYFNGNRMYMVFEDDPGYVYSGRFIVSEWEDGKDYSSFSISCFLDYEVLDNEFVY